MRVIVGIVGAVVVLSTISSLLRTLVVPRALRSRITQVVQTSVRVPLQLVADRLDRFELKDRVLAYGAPVTIVCNLLVWLAGFLLGYGLLLFSVSPMPLAVAMREAGSSLFTLGFASSDRGQLTIVDFVAAVTGPTAIGILVGYLPALYGAYARREAEVTLLEVRGGHPAWGPEILARHADVDLLDGLYDLYRDWERWCADIRESHTSYATLIHFRSPVADRNWLIGLLAVMDSAALHLAFNPSTPQARTVRLALRAGFVSLRDIARVERIPFDPDPSPDGPIELTYEKFLIGVKRMRAGKYTMEREPEAAWPHFRGWRVNYESIAYALAYRIDAVPAPWSGPRRTSQEPLSVVSVIDRRPAIR
jgi:hypothetical protein